jgi:hypothetical protein
MTVHDASAATHYFNKPLWLVVVILSTLLLLSGMYKFVRWRESRVIANAGLDQSCDLRLGECVSEMPGGGQVSLSITPDNLPVLRPLQLKVSVGDIPVSDVQVDFVGINLQMGYIRSSLTAESDTDYIGDIVLPVCVRSKMDWEARVILRTDRGLLVAPYRFYTIR